MSKFYDIFTIVLLNMIKYLWSN